MDFVINKNELEALYGLPHCQQIVYLRGIRPFIDISTSIVGEKRGISYQSIAEELYVEPHQGVKSISFSRAQIKRAILSLERVGLISIQSEERKLILKCNLATGYHFVQNKAVTKPSQQAVIGRLLQPTENNDVTEVVHTKPVIGDTPKAVTPLYNNNYIYIFIQNAFEKFWALYPQKKSKGQAWDAFVALNPSEELFEKIMTALKNQIDNHHASELANCWVASWKHPANWLIQQCWEDEIVTPVSSNKEKIHEKYSKNHSRRSGVDTFSDGCSEASFEFEDESEAGDPSHNVIQFRGV